MGAQGPRVAEIQAITHNAVQPPPKKTKTRALITREADLDTVDKKMIASLPRAGRAMDAAMKKCPSNKLLGAGEMWVMLD